MWEIYKILIMSEIIFFNNFKLKIIPTGKKKILSLLFYRYIYNV